MGFDENKYNVSIKTFEKSINLMFESSICWRMFSYSILAVDDPQEIAKLGYFEAAFSKLISKVMEHLITQFVRMKFEGIFEFPRSYFF